MHCISMYLIALMLFLSPAVIPAQAQDMSSGKAPSRPAALTACLRTAPRQPEVCNNKVRPGI